MKICFLSTGTFIHTQPYIDYFKEKGHEVSFIAISPSPERSVPVLRAWTGKGANPKINSEKWKYFLAARKARGIIKKLNPDIVHAHYATSGGIAAWISRHRHTVITVHGSDVNSSINSPIWRFLLKKIFSSAQLINVVSDELERKVVQLGIASSKVVNINVGINYDQYFVNRSIAAMEKVELKLICNRRLEPVYDPLTILQALLILKNRGIPFTMTFIGDGQLKEQLITYASDHQLSSHINFLGQLLYNDQPAVFKEHSIYISASKSDGTSLSLLEAMAAGLFPLVSDIPANRALLKANETALMFPVGNAEALAHCLEQLYLNKINMEKAITANQAFVEKGGNRKRNMQLLEEAFNNIIKSR